MAIGIRPTVDFAFKLLFGSPDHTRVTVHFLNAILGPHAKITSVTIQNPFLGKSGEEDKLSILDVLATDQDGRILNIEMQSTLPAGMHQRLVYYVARLYAGQLTEGEHYSGLNSAINICVLTKPLFADRGDLHMDFQMRTSSGLRLTDDLQVHLLQLSNLGITAKNISKASAIEQWAYFMLNAEEMTMKDVELIFSDEEFAEAAGVLQMISKTPEQQYLYDARLKLQRDEAARLEQARNEGLQEGQVKGEAKGEIRGVRRGLLLGKISILLELLGLNSPSSDELSELEEIKLADLEEQLRIKLLNRK